MTRDLPERLIELRRLTADSVGWYLGNRKVTWEQREAMRSKDREMTRFGAKPALVEELVAAEQAFTRTYEKGGGPFEE